MPLILLGSLIVCCVFLGWLGVLAWIGLWFVLFGLMAKA